MIELLLALALASLLLLGAAALLDSTGRSNRVQDNLADMQANAQLAFALLSEAVRGLGFRPQPWLAEYALEGLGPGTADGVTAKSDRLEVSEWSDRDCFDNRNSERGPDGRPLFFIRRSRFVLNGSRFLARSCSYGPSEAEQVQQVRNQGLVGGVESFQLQLGMDTDDDGRVDNWKPADAEADRAMALGIRFGLVFRSEDAVTEPARRSLSVLDTRLTSPADGRLRRIRELTVAIRERLR